MKNLMGGLELISRNRQELPGVKVIVMSGCMDAVCDPLLIGAHKALRKQFSNDDLRWAMEETSHLEKAEADRRRRSVKNANVPKTYGDVPKPHFRRDHRKV
jgi:DNA-binding NtrC family response regulator